MVMRREKIPDGALARRVLMFGTIQKLVEEE